MPPDLYVQKKKKKKFVVFTRSCLGILSHPCPQPFFYLCSSSFAKKACACLSPIPLAALLWVSVSLLHHPPFPSLLSPLLPLGVRTHDQRPRWGKGSLLYRHPSPPPRWNMRETERSKIMPRRIFWDDIVSNECRCLTPGGKNNAPAPPFLHVQKNMMPNFLLHASAVSL